MYIFNQDGDAFYQSDKVKRFWVSEESDTLYADGDWLGNYNNRDEAIKELNNIFGQIETGASSYQVR